MKDYSEAKKAIVYGIIASIIVFFIQPLLGLTGQALKWLGTNVYAGFVDGIYATAARGDSESSSMMLLTIVILGGIIIGWGVLFQILPGELKEWSTKSTDARIPKTFEAVQTEKQRLETEVEAMRWASLAIFRMGQVAFVFAAVWYFLQFANISSAHSLNVSFNQRLNALALHISDEEHKGLLAQWATMRSQQDFISIDTKLNDIAQQSGIKIPKPPWWAFD